MQSDDFWQGSREESMAIGCKKDIFVQDQDGSQRESAQDSQSFPSRRIGNGMSDFLCILGSWDV